MDAAEKKKIIEEYATHPGDTGSPDVQVAILTKRIAELTEHLKVHKGDHHSSWPDAYGWSASSVAQLHREE